MSFSRESEPTPELNAAIIEIRQQQRTGQITFEAAVEQLNDLLKDAKKRRHVADQAKVHNAMGIFYSNQGKLSESLNSYRQALHLSKIVNNINQTAIINMNMGEIYRRKGDYREALKFYNQAFNLSKNLTQWTTVPAGSLINMGETLYQMRQYDEAQQTLLDAIQRIETTWPDDSPERPYALGEVYAYLGHVYLQRKNLNAALDAAAKTYEYVKDVKDHHIMGLMHRLYGDIFTRYPQATSGLFESNDPDFHFDKAVHHLKEVNFASELGRTYLMQAESRRTRGIRQGTDDYYREALAIFGRLGMHGMLSTTLEARAKLGQEKP